MPKDKKYDAIVLVEVIEHFIDPKYNFDMLFNRLSDDGIICGTTNFHFGGSIEDGNDPGYMSIKNHVSYWSLSSMRFISNNFGMHVSTFEMIRPGSVLPDEKYHQIYPNKRVFFIYNPIHYENYFEKLHQNTPILPIDNP